MVVDDEPQILTVVRMMLEKEGYEVIDAKNGEECLMKLKKEIPDLILLDVMMPGKDGWDILKEIKKTEKTKNIPIAMLTVRASDNSAKKSLEYGADDHINKPYAINEFIEQVKRLLGNAASP